MKFIIQSLFLSLLLHSCTSPIVKTNSLSREPSQTATQSVYLSLATSSL